MKLKNGGINAYQEEVYGDMICIERHFSRAGASGFKIKSATGRIISTKRFDLEEICDYYALQLDNPMNVLTQDMARQFLSNSSPADKYKFFVRGVHLEQLDQDYKLLEESTEKMEAKLESRVADVKALEERASKAAGRLALSDRQDTLRQKIRGYGRQMAWAQVEEQEQVQSHRRRCDLNICLSSDLSRRSFNRWKPTYDERKSEFRRPNRVSKG